MADERKVQLSAEVDASGARQGFADIKNDARDMAQAVSQAGQQAGKGLDAVGAGGEKSAQTLDRSTKSIIASIQRTTAAMEAGSRGTSQYYEAIAGQRGANVDALKPYLAQLDAAVQKQNAARQSLTGVGLSAEQTAQALRSVPAQFTDIVTSLASGQQPMMVLIQQGGQLKDMFGGAGAAARAIGGYVASLVNPFSVAAVAAGALAYAYHEGSAEAMAFGKAVIASGNAAGTSVNQLQNLQSSVQAATGATKGAVADALNEIVATGNVAASALGMVANSALLMQKASGKAVAETVEEFASLGKEPVRASEKLNEKYNYLTVAVYAQIKALEEQGQGMAAVALAQKAYADASDDMAAKLKANLGTLETAWSSLKSGAKSAWDAMLDIGREGSLDERIAKARKSLESGGSFFGGESEARARIAVLEAQRDKEKATTDEKARQNALNRAGIEWLKEGDKYLSKQAQMEQEITRAKALGLAAGRSEIEIARRVADIREKMSEKGKSQATKDAEELAALLDKVSGKKAGLDANYWSDLETLHKAYQKGKLSLDDYRAAVVNLTQEQKFAKDAAKAEIEGIKLRSELVGKMVDDERKRGEALLKGSATLRDEIALLGLSKAEQDLYRASKLDSAAASDLATASAIDAMKAEWEMNGVMPEIIAGYEALAEAKRASAAATSEQAALSREKAAKEVAVKQAEDSAKAWEKFSDDINRSLTDSLYRAFESGESFGEAFAKSLRNTFKALALKFAVQYTIDASGSLAKSAINAAFGTSFGGGAGGGSSMSGALGAANNLSTAYSLYNNAGILAQWAGGSMSTANALGTVYANATTTGSYTALDGLLATNGAYGTAGAGGAAGGSGGASASGAGVSTIAWVAAIVAGMWMSSQAWKAGIRWENYAKEKGSEYDLETYIRASKDKPMATLFGKDFVNSEFYAVMGGGSLSAQIHGALKSALWGRERVTGSQITGAFSEAEQGFSGMQGVNYKRSGSLFRRSKEWTEWYALPAEVDSAMDTIYRGVRNSFVMLGEVFEDTSLAAKLQGFVYSFTVGELSVESVTTGLSEAMSGVLTPSINAARKTGETWSQAFQRVLEEANAVRRMMEMMGDSLITTFGKNNLDGILRASDAFVQLFGSVDAFNQSFAGYYSNFYTTSEQAAQAWRDMKFAFDGIGKAMPTSRQGFRDLVDSLDLSTDAGRSTFAQLMRLQGAFAALVPTLEEAAAAATAMQKAAQEMQAQQVGNFYAAQRKAQEDAVRQQMTQASDAASVASSLIASYTEIRDSLSAYRLGLGTGADTASSPLARYAAARSAFDATSAQARLGNVEAAGKLQGLAETLLQVSREVGSSIDYARDVAGVIGVVDQVVGVADRQIPIAEAGLKVAQDQLTALQGILDRMTGNAVPAVVADYQKAATDWAQFFTGTAIGQSVQTSAGTMQRLSESMALFIDAAGRGYAFSQSDNPYTLAGQSDAYRQYLLDKYGKWTAPAFAAGGVHAGGLRLVGERGPELEFTGPSAIVDASTTAAVLGNAGALLGAVRDLQREVEALRAEQRVGHAAIVSTSAKAARTLEKFDLDGLPEVRVS